MRFWTVKRFSRNVSNQKSYIYLYRKKKWLGGEESGIDAPHIYWYYYLIFSKNVKYYYYKTCSYLWWSDYNAVAVALLTASGLQTLHAAQYGFGSVSEPLTTRSPEPRGGQRRVGSVRCNYGSLRYVTTAPDALLLLVRVLQIVHRNVIFVGRRLQHCVDDVVHPGPSSRFPLEHPIFAQGTFPFRVRVINLQTQKITTSHI